jgi:Ca-activated chloride channel homolog
VTFLWPKVLALFSVVPALMGAYVWILRRRSRVHVRYPTVELVAEAAAPSHAWRRYLVAALYLSTLCGVIFTLARPVAPIPVPNNQAAIMLSIDVSRSMLSRDVVPNRIEAAKKAAVEFVLALPRGAKVGLVSFSSFATLLVPPTEDHDRVTEAIRSLSPAYGTAIGDGLLEAVYAFPGRVRPADPTRFGVPDVTAPHGSDRLSPATVVLLSDGQNNRGTPPSDAAPIARQWRVKVHTVGLGKPEGTFLEFSGRSVFVRLDEETLKEIARVTGGSYVRVGSSRELSRAYAGLGRLIGWERKPTEVSGLASVVLAALFAATVAISLMWTQLLN